MTFYVRGSENSVTFCFISIDARLSRHLMSSGVSGSHAVKALRLDLADDAMQSVYSEKSAVWNCECC